jgi:hypothetical protein
LFSRPRDRSPEAYKAWILEMLKQLTGKDDDGRISDKEWKVRCARFWAKSDHETLSEP